MVISFPVPQRITKWHATSYPAIDTARQELSARGKTVAVPGRGPRTAASLALLRHAAKDAYLLNISTGVSHMPAFPTGISAYAVSKAAAVKLFDYFALENPGIHIVNVQPGVVDTDMSHKGGVTGQDRG